MEICLSACQTKRVVLSSAAQLESHVPGQRTKKVPTTGNTTLIRGAEKEAATHYRPGGHQSTRMTEREEHGDGLKASKTE